MSKKLTKQGIPNLDSLGGGSKKNLNGRRDKDQQNCFHVWEDCFDDNYAPFRKCQRCGFEDS